MANLDATMDNLESWQAAMIAWDNAPPVALPVHRFGVHWIADQFRQADLDYMSALKPPVIKIVNPTLDRVKEALARIDPNGHVALRYHPISEQQSELAANPEGLAREHAAYWRNQFANAYTSVDRSRLWVMGINEPDVSNLAAMQRLARYTDVLITELNGIPIYAYNLSVGWPMEVAGEIIWSPFMGQQDLINQSKSFVCVHEYWYPDPANGWNSYANRVSRSPMNCHFIIGECGYTRKLAGLPQPWGWNGNVSADVYAQQLWYYHDKVAPEKVFAVLPFTTSYGGQEWANKDTAPCSQQILNRKRAFNWPDSWKGKPPVSDSKLIIYPKFAGAVSGWYGSVYTNSAGGKYAHEGLDLPNPIGTPVYAPADGVVAWSDTDTLYGEYIRTYHAQLDTCFFFAHLSERKVQKGATIKQGQLIGLTGSTGNSTGPHLHFEARAMTEAGAYRSGWSAHGNARVDPLGWLAGWIAAGNRYEER